jgi:hypothetical protein
LDFAPRSKKEIKETLELVDSLEMQCILQRDKAFLEKDFQVTWMMETQRVNFAICRQAIKWATGLTDIPAFDAGTVGEFLVEDE